MTLWWDSDEEKREKKKKLPANCGIWGKEAVCMILSCRVTSDKLNACCKINLVTSSMSWKAFAMRLTHVPSSPLLQRAVWQPLGAALCGLPAQRCITQDDGIMLEWCTLKKARAPGNDSLPETNSQHHHSTCASVKIDKRWCKYLYYI